MLRFYLLIIFSIHLILYYIFMSNYYCKHEDRYDELSCYKLAKRMISDIKRRANIRTVHFGSENLPKDGGYIMYANHQGKYDALGIMDSHEKPCSVIMDAERSRMVLANEVMNLVRGVRLERHDFKQQVRVLDKMSEDTRHGKRYIYFPEGGYEHNGNKLQEFRPGAFKVAMRANCPIVPVAIYDSHIPFDFNSLRRVTTQVYFMDPIYPEDYADMSTQQVSMMVKELIENKLDELEENRRKNHYNMWFKEYKSLEA